MLARVHPRALGVQVGLFCIVLLLWDTPIVYPLKILVVFFHEISHGLAAVLTGGEIVQIEVVAQEGGYCITRGGNRFATLTAGYLGSLAWGGAILILASRTQLDRALAGALGIMLIATSVVYVSPKSSFGFLFGITAGAGLLAMAAYLSERINDGALRLVGLTSCLYAVLDIKSDVLDRPHLPSDAAMLAELTGVPAVIWGILWIGAAAVVAALCLLHASAMPAVAARPRRAA